MGFLLNFFDVSRRCLQARVRSETSSIYRCVGHSPLNGCNFSLQAGLFSATLFASGSLQTGGETWR